MIERIRTYCSFCEKELEDYKIFPPKCDCEGFHKYEEKRLEEIKSDSDYEPPLEEGEYDKKYPQMFLGERLVLDKDGHHKLKLEARKYDDGEGLRIWIPFFDDENDAGICWDFTDKDAEALHDLLSEYLESKKCR